MNKKMILSFEKSLHSLAEEIKIINEDNEIKDKIDLFKKIGDCVNWLYGIIERINDAELTEEECKILGAFRGAANVLKHSKSFSGFEKFINCSRFPFYLPAMLGDTPSITWQELDKGSIKMESQINSYNEVLANKDILSTMNEAYEIVLKVFEGDECSE